MSKRVVVPVQTIVRAICDRVTNKFDAFIVIEGRRGLGKSTLGYELLKKVRAEMKRRGVDGYKFSPKRDLIYTKKDVQKFFHKWQHSAMADEMINVAFNRDFHNEEQKDIIKMINMNRDHCNIFIACVPQFRVLDSQIKNLCSIKITVVKRGVAVLHRPNSTIYSSDIWDEKYNEKIERSWLEKGIKNPKYARLSTYRGMVKFPPLKPKEEALYQDIKTKNRNVIAREKGLEEVQGKGQTPFEKVYQMLREGKIKNSTMLNGIAMSMGIKEHSLRGQLLRNLKDDGIYESVTSFYSDTKKKAKAIACVPSTFE